MPKLATQVYKVHGTYYFFPASEMWTQIPSLTVKLIFALGPQLKGTFNCIETIETRTTYPIPQKTGPKRPKVNVNPRFISPIWTWAQITPPPPPSWYRKGNYYGGGDKLISIQPKISWSSLWIQTIYWFLPATNYESLNIIKLSHHCRPPLPTFLSLTFNFLRVAPQILISELNIPATLV